MTAAAARRDITTTQAMPEPDESYTWPTVRSVAPEIKVPSTDDMPFILPRCDAGIRLETYGPSATVDNISPRVNRNIAT